MTDLSKIPLPRDPEDGPQHDSLIERAAERFDFNRYIAGPKLADLPPPRRPVRAPARPKAAAPAPEPMPVPMPAPARAPIVDAAPTPIAAPEVAPEPAPEPVVFSSNRLEIDREHLRTNGLIVPEGSVTALLEEFRIVKRQLLVQAAELRRQKAGSKAQRVLISSPHPGEGKTYCATNLALSIAAEKESDVLLVDADFAKPSILSSLGLPGGPGLMDALMDESADVADFVIATDIPGLWVLPAGDTSTSDSEYISSSRTAKILDRLTEGAPNRMVIFDSPPALAASPAAELAKLVGQVLVIVRADSTGQGALEDAVSLLSACPNIQLLLNAAQFSPSGRRFGTYYGYKA
jgi:Mrp family chromosome partitioning ATPase